MNQRPFDSESSLLPTRPDFRPKILLFLLFGQFGESYRWGLVHAIFVIDLNCDGYKGLSINNVIGAVKYYASTALGTLVLKSVTVSKIIQKLRDVIYGWPLS